MAKKKNEQLSMLVQAEIDMSQAAIAKMQKQLDKVGKQLKMVIGGETGSSSTTKRAINENVKLRREISKQIAEAGVLRKENRITNDQYIAQLKAIREAYDDTILTQRHRINIADGLKKAEKELGKTTISNTGNEIQRVKIVRSSISSMEKLKNRVDAHKITQEEFLKYSQRIIESERFLNKTTDEQAKIYRVRENVEKSFRRAREQTYQLSKKIAADSKTSQGSSGGVIGSGTGTSTSTKMEDNALIASVRRHIWINDQKYKSDKLYAAQKKKLLEDIQHFEYKNAKLLKSKATTSINGVTFSSDNIAEEIKVLKTQVNSASGPMTEFAGRFKQLGRNAEYVRTSIKNQTKDGYGLITMAEIAAKKVAIWAASTLAIYGPLRLIGSGIQYVIDLDNALNEIRIVTGQSQEEVEALAGSYNKLAQEMSVTTKEITEQAAELYRQGLSQSEVEDRMKAIITYSKISGISMEESNKIITATANATERSVTDIINVFALLGRICSVM
jgi:hypothetical protein